MELIEGREYNIDTNFDEVLKVKLDSIKRYPAGGFPPDFLFIRLEGPDNLCYKNQKIDDRLTEGQKAYTLKMQKECPEGFIIPNYIIEELIGTKTITEA